MEAGRLWKGERPKSGAGALLHRTAGVRNFHLLWPRPPPFPRLPAYQEMNLTLFAELLDATPPKTGAKAVLIENW